MDDGSNKVKMIAETVVIFGVFDGIHKGHLKFIHEAKKQGKKLVVVVARDYIISSLKNKIPIYNELERLRKISEIKEVDSVFLGDKEQGDYFVLKKINPGIIFLGYDQRDLYNSLRQKINEEGLPKIKLIFGKPYEPEKYHSSILNK